MNHIQCEERHKPQMTEPALSIFLPYDRCFERAWTNSIRVNKPPQGSNTRPNYQPFDIILKGPKTSLPEDRDHLIIEITIHKLA